MATLLGERSAPANNFIEYLRSIPKSEAIEFPRTKDHPREDAWELKLTVVTHNVADFERSGANTVNPFS